MGGVVLVARALSLNLDNLGKISLVFSSTSPHAGFIAHLVDLSCFLQNGFFEFDDFFIKGVNLLLVICILRLLQMDLQFL